VLGAQRTLQLSGPAADTSVDVSNNGIQSTPNGKALIVAHSEQGALNTVDPTTGASATIAGVSVPFVDGILLQGGQLFAVQNFLNQIAELRLSPNLTSGNRREGRHQRAVPGPDHRRPLRRPPRHGERQVRHRNPADGRTVRGDHRRPLRGDPSEGQP
jgi:hypothetical protein